MAFITPYVTDNSVTYKGDTRLTLLSMAIRLIDDFTGKEATGNIKVVTKEAGIEAIKNPSGYYIFTDRGNYTVDISSDRYFPPADKVMIDTPILNFDNNGGPASGAISTKLKDVSKLQEGDKVEFYNLAGDIEQRSIARIDPDEKTIFWAGGLRYDFTAKGSSILTLKKNPVVTVHLIPLPSYPFPNNATLVRGMLIDSSNIPVVDASISVASKDLKTKSDKNGEFVLYFSNVKTNENISILINGNPNSIDTNLEEGMTKYLGKIVFP